MLTYKKTYRKCRHLLIKQKFNPGMLVRTWLQTQLTFLDSDLFIAINVSIDAVFNLEGVLPESMFQSTGFIRQQTGFYLSEQKMRFCRSMLQSFRISIDLSDILFQMMNLVQILSVHVARLDLTCNLVSLADGKLEVETDLCGPSIATFNLWSMWSLATFSRLSAGTWLLSSLVV